MQAQTSDAARRPLSRFWQRLFAPPTPEELAPPDEPAPVAGPSETPAHLPQLTGVSVEGKHRETPASS